MQLSAIILAFTASFISTTASHPTSPSTILKRQSGFKLATCGAEYCLSTDPPTYSNCELNDLACLCRLDQPAITEYVSTVQPCIDGIPGQTFCTPGAIYQYKDLLQSVCAREDFGSKIVDWGVTVGE